MHAIATCLVGIVVFTQCGANCQKDPLAKDRIEKIVDTVLRCQRYHDELFRGPPAGLPPDKRRDWTREIFIKLLKCQVELKMELTILFFDKPCPQAIKRFMLAYPDSPDSIPIMEFFLHYKMLLSDNAAKNFQLSLLEVLDSEDPELKHLLPKFRKEFVPSSSHDTDWLRKKGKQVPLWYIDRAYTYSMSNWDHYSEPPEQEALQKIFGGLWNPDFMVKNREELEWTFHVVNTYRRRWSWDWDRQGRAPNRVQPGDLELARKQLKWLWDTKEWWARRYVVETLGRCPPLAFEKAIQELEKENHPYVKPRIQELQLIRILQERGFGK